MILLITNSSFYGTTTSKIMFLIIVEKEIMQATTVTVGGIVLYNIVNFSSVNELYKNTFVIAWLTLAKCFGQMIHDFATPVCLWSPWVTPQKCYFIYLCCLAQLGWLISNCVASPKVTKASRVA